MPRVRVNGVDLYFEEQGEGVPVLGIHGTPSSALAWVAAARELAKHGRSIIYDRRGFFRSAPATPFTSLDLLEHVDDAAALLAALHAGPAVVIGRSTGGQIALELARHFPDKVKGLVLLEPALFTIDPKANAWAADLRKRVLRRAAENPAAAAEALLRDILGDDVWESLPDKLKGMFLDTGPALLAEMKGRGLDLSQEPATWTEAELAAISCPALIVSGEDSLEACRLVNVRLAAALPQAEAVLVRGGHLIDPSHPDVLSFIDRISA
ncbi:alpha/beta fold hydrolase [Pseudarthrobacter sp. L1SW]|uniref:alpha/beta fold hydrolase n=1 Tax=Pseudarthrobacter sp. L1SW TaxID=2851598 RepID=UPI001E3EDAC1|nr:alpha/beta hydrolase [Pseudarthrobacter sp. L1SW]UEL27769.1 alpha/beta hydrolase [Pseudarthrobacter sp. L1SW]